MWGFRTRFSPLATNHLPLFFRLRTLDCLSRHLSLRSQFRCPLGNRPEGQPGCVPFHCGETDEWQGHLPIPALDPSTAVLEVLDIVGDDRTNLFAAPTLTGPFLLTCVRLQATVDRVKIRSFIHKGLKRLYEEDSAKGVSPDMVDKLRKMSLEDYH